VSPSGAARTTLPHADRAGFPGAVLHGDRPAEDRGQLVGNRTRDNIAEAAGQERNDELHRTVLGMARRGAPEREEEHGGRP
jgi:hypothetical protein